MAGRLFRRCKVACSLLMLAGAAALLPACVGSRPGRGIVPIDGLVREQATIGKWFVDVNNANGPVFVRVDPKLKNPRVLASAPGRTDAVDPAKLVAAVAGLNERGFMLQVSAQHVDGLSPAAEAQSVTLDITIPESWGVRVRNNGGSVELSGISGAIEVVSGVPSDRGGNVRITTKSDLAQGIKVQTSRGDVLIRMGAKSTGNVDVRGGTGVSVEVPPGEELRGIKEERGRWRASIGLGEQPIDVNAEHGFAEVRFNPR